MATIYNIKIKLVSPFVAYNETDMNNIVESILKDYRDPITNLGFESIIVNTEFHYKSKYIVSTTNWFAWFPVKTDLGWTWLKTVKKTYDERPELYQGLLPQTYYEKL